MIDNDPEWSSKLLNNIQKELKMKRRGKNVYLTSESLRGLEEIGKKYISRKFKEGSRISYNKACLYLLQTFRIAEGLRIGESIEENNESG